MDTAESERLKRPRFCLSSNSESLQWSLVLITETVSNGVRWMTGTFVPGLCCIGLLFSVFRSPNAVNRSSYLQHSPSPLRARASGSGAAYLR